ncbi:hypothetical protein Tco_0637608 [Tanacetum coccineum]
MDPMISLGQKNTLAEYMILSNADNRPPILKMEQFQVNTKFLNSLPPEWSKFVTHVKLVKDLHTSNFDQLHAYLEQHELHENEVRIMRERNQYPLAFVLLQGFLLPIISSELPLIQETKPLFKMVRLPYNKFRGDKGKIILVQHIKAMLLVQGEIQQVDKLELLNATTAKVKDIWLANDSAKREVEVPSALPKKRSHFALEEGKWGFKHTKTVFNKEIIPFLKSLKDIFNVFDKDLLNEITEIERDAEIARIHAEEDLRQMINELDRSNVMINKHMAEYEEAENDLTIEEKTELITELINYQKDFARIKKYQAQQQRLASKSERRKFYTSVLRSHAGWKTKDLRGMTFDQLEEKFIPVWESIQDFVPMDSKKESESLKRSGILLEKVKAKRLKTSDVSAQEQQESDNQDEIINLQQWAVLVREETSVNITPSVVKVPICDWKIYKDKLREVYQIFRVGQAPKVYPYFESMLKDFDRDDLVTLWKLVKDRFKTELPKSDLEKCLFWPLKVMFEPVATDLLWQFEAPIKSWKMYKSCKVHCLSMEGMIIYMLDDVEYPFQKTTLKKMLDHKCEVSEFNEDVIQMINLIRGQLKKE